MSTYDQIATKHEEIGILKGRNEGKTEEKIKTITNGYKNGLSFEILAIITELSIEEVQEIIKKHC